MDYYNPALQRYLDKVDEVCDQLMIVIASQTCPCDADAKEFFGRHKLAWSYEPINRAGTLGYAVYFDGQRIGWVAHENGKIRAEIAMGVLL